MVIRASASGYGIKRGPAALPQHVAVQAGQGRTGAVGLSQEKQRGCESMLTTERKFQNT